MELRHLRYFVAVAEEQNITRASTALHVSQPALSRQIRDLEEELGVQLLERSAKTVRLTEPGRIFLEEARAVLLRTDEAVMKVKAAGGGMIGELHVGYAPSLTVELLPRALRSFQTAFPGVRVTLHDLSTEEMLVRVQAGALHLALIAQPSPAKLAGLKFEELARYPIQAAVEQGHPLAKRRNISRTEVASHPLIAYSRTEYPEYHALLAQLFTDSSGKIRIAEEHDSVTSLIVAVEPGRGIAIVPSCLECMAGPRLKFLPLRPTAGPIIVGAIKKNGSTPPQVERFIDAARKETPKR